MKSLIRTEKATLLNIEDEKENPQQILPSNIIERDEHILTKLRNLKVLKVADNQSISDADIHNSARLLYRENIYHKDESIRLPNGRIISRYFSHGHILQRDFNIFRVSGCKQNFSTLTSALEEAKLSREANDL